MASRATGKLAYGFCDRSGRRYPLKDLIPQIENGFPNGLLVGRDMFDIDHEQWKLGEIDAAEDISLKDPRPDLSQVESRGLSAWNPVGGGVTVFGSQTVGLDMKLSVGKVSIS